MVCLLTKVLVVLLILKVNLPWSAGVNRYSDTVTFPQPSAKGPKITGKN